MMRAGMDERTVEAYERVAVEYGERRRAYHPERAEAFAGVVPAGRVRLDLGSGPGHYLPHLGRPVVAADAAVAMVGEVRRRHPATPALACDLEALPFRHGSLGGIWASKSLQHVPAERLPTALAGLHRALDLGGVLDATLFDQTGDTLDGSTSTTDRVEVTSADDDFPGRLFSFWTPEALGHVLTGAGFVVEEVGADRPGGDSVRRVFARARRARSLPDTVGPGMTMLVCGLNPSLYAADAGIGFARPGNRFWRAARTAGLVTADRDPDLALRRDGVGMTDLVKRATIAANELTTDEYRAGLVRVTHLVDWLRPGVVCFVGLAGWRAAVDRHAAAGPQPADLAGVPVYVMPSTSGLNASSSPTDLTTHLRAALRLTTVEAGGRSVPSA
jgi:double-stranded uracil-DNA glycosylase